MSPGLTQWIKDPTLLWLWHRLINRPLAWEPPHAASTALKRQKKKKKKKIKLKIKSHVATMHALRFVYLLFIPHIPKNI